jgi:VWFA-related protein
MKKALTLLLSACILCAAAVAQTSAPVQGKQPQQQPEEEDVVRITSELVQTDVVVTDKEDQIVNDLKLSDFEVYENGRKQDLKFMEFVSVDAPPRTEGDASGVTIAGKPVETDLPHDLAARDVRRVIAFVVDDLTIPFEDLSAVRQLLTDFVDNKMKDGDLVAIVRVVGGKGLLQQLTSDRQMLRRAIAELNVATNPFMAYNNPAAVGRQAANPAAPAEGAGDQDIVNFEDLGLQDFTDPNNETQRLFRGLFSLTTAGYVIDSMKDIPGRKSMVLISGGVPIFEVSNTGSVFSNITYLLNQLTDKAVRAGVVINTLDPRGLKASPGVAGFNQTPGRSALSDPDPSFGRGGGTDAMFGTPLAGAEEHLGLGVLSNATGGVSVVNTNNFKEGLDRVLARGRGYYLLAYTPSEKFDKKFHRLQIKVKREGVKVYTHQGYFARPDVKGAPHTKEETIVMAAQSPLARRDVDVSANITLKPPAAPARKTTTLDIHLLIDPHKLSFRQSDDGKYHTSFDVVGFVYDQVGKLRGGFSETVTSNLSSDEYQHALATGLTYSATTELPPGYFQFRGVVRETETGNLGTLSKYLEVPDLSNGRLAMSSLFLFAADPAPRASAAPTPLLALRQISRKQDLRYAALVYNARVAGGKPQLSSQVIISRSGKVVYQEPEQPVESVSTSPVTKVGQIGLSKVPPGRYVLTLLITDPLADKKSRMVARSIDFTLVN